jgi:hypothetical protein
VTKRKRREVRDAAERIKDKPERKRPDPALEAFFRRWGLNERPRSRLEALGAPPEVDEHLRALRKRLAEVPEAAKPNAPAEGKRGRGRPRESTSINYEHDVDLFIEFWLSHPSAFSQKTLVDLICHAYAHWHGRTLAKSSVTRRIAALRERE